MNELLIDYTKKEVLTSRRRRNMILTGSIIIAFSLAIFITSIRQNLGAFLLASAICNLVLGSLIIVQGFENKIFDQTKYLSISDDGIEHKLGHFHSMVKMKWDSDTGIEIFARSIQIKQKDKNTKLKMIHFKSTDEKKIKGLLLAIGQARNLIKTK